MGMRDHLRVLDDHIERVIARGCCGCDRPSKGAICYMRTSIGYERPAKGAI